MAANSSKLTPLAPLDFSLFLRSHRKRYKLDRVPRNRFGQIIPKSHLEKFPPPKDPDSVPTIDYDPTSRYMMNRYADKTSVEGKALYKIIQSIEKDIGKPFDARQALLMSLIRSKVVIIMQIGKYLEGVDEIVDYKKGKVPKVVDGTFFTASNSLRAALKELYATAKKKRKRTKTYEDLVEEMNKKEKNSSDG